LGESRRDEVSILPGRQKIDHCIVMEGGIDEQGKFHHVPTVDLTSLCEVFRQAVMRLFKRLDLLQEKFFRNMLSWVHSGFTVECSKGGLPANAPGGQSICETQSVCYPGHRR
jgi:hypothetical protein